MIEDTDLDAANITRSNWSILSTFQKWALLPQLIKPLIPKFSQNMSPVQIFARKIIVLSNFIESSLAVFVPSNIPFNRKIHYYWF